MPYTTLMKIVIVVVAVVVVVVVVFLHRHIQKRHSDLMRTYSYR